MAQVKRAEHPEVDSLLEYLLRHWRSLNEVASEWSSWESIDQEVFQMEWGLTEEKLAKLQHYVGETRLTGAQDARYRQLLTVVRKNRPILERLFRQ